MTTTRHGHVRKTPGGGQAYVRQHQLKGGGGHGMPKATYADRVRLAKDAGLASLTGLVVYGAARMLLLTTLAILTAVCAALLAMIGLQFRTQRRRRARLTTRAKRWARRKAKLAWIHGRQRMRPAVAARTRRNPRTGKPVSLRKPKLDGMNPGNWPAEERQQT